MTKPLYLRKDIPDPVVNLPSVPHFLESSLVTEALPVKKSFKSVN